MTPAAARRDLLDLARRARLGRLAPLGGPHHYDPVACREFRRAAILILLTPSATLSEDVDLFLVQRSAHLRDHPGQIALPGGGIEASDASAQHAALRETHEEIGLPPQRVEVLGELGKVSVPVSSFVVTPVLGWCWEAGALVPSSEGEVLHTLRVPVTTLLGPDIRATVHISEHTSAGFALPQGWVWGFTGNVLDYLFCELGWERPWPRQRRHALSLDEAMGGMPPPEATRTEGDDTSH